MKKDLLFIVFSLMTLVLVAQAPLTVESENMIPNPSFERYSSTPIGWFYKGKHFTDVVKYWSSATGSSPDVFGPKVRVPAHWAAKGFGEQKARSGESMIGITVYGCDEGKPHCREYAQIQLREPLVVGQNYAVEFFVSHLPRSIQVNNIGMYFSEKKFKEIMDIPIEATPQVFSKEILESGDGQWIKYGETFKATSNAQYLLIGNFFPDSLTQTKITKQNTLRYGYYYIDDVMVKKIPPMIDVPVEEDDLSLVSLEQGKVIPLKNIFFDTDKSELLPQSHVELQKLLVLMQSNPEMTIEIRGHTDTDGDFDYNIQLSARRAQAVVNYLIHRGIESNRTFYKGFGSTQPIGDNITDSGKQLNRRVEFLILKK
ncbi:MAG: OmpA family protein [Bacteroidota bacterium]